MENKVGILINNQDKMLEAIKINPKAIKLIGNDLQNDIKFYKKAIAVNKEVLYYLPQDLRENRLFIVLIASEYPEVILFAEEKLRKELRKDKQFILKVLYDQYNKTYGNPTIMLFIDDKLKKDKEFILEVVKTNYKTYMYLRDEFLKDEDIINEVSKHNSDYIDLINNKENKNQL